MENECRWLICSSHPGVFGKVARCMYMVTGTLAGSLSYTDLTWFFSVATSQQHLSVSQPLNVYPHTIPMKPLLLLPNKKIECQVNVMLKVKKVCGKSQVYGSPNWRSQSDGIYDGVCLMLLQIIESWNTWRWNSIKYLLNTTKVFNWMFPLWILPLSPQQEAGGFYR